MATTMTTTTMAKTAVFSSCLDNDMVEVLQGKRGNVRSVEDKNLVTTLDTHSQLWTPSLQVN